MTGISFRNYRKALGLTQKQLADLMGFTGPSRRERIGRIERARKPVPRLHARLMQAYVDGHRPDDWPLKSERETV